LFAAAATLAAAALLVSGCGFGPGSQEGSAELIVSSDYGRQVLVERSLDDLTESETAMRVLDDSAEVETRYGGGFVQSVDGLQGGTEAGRSLDWFFAVNGIVAERGSAEFPVNAGDQVWWDYRDWTDAMDIGAVVGAWPAPMTGGYDGEVWPVNIECAGDRAACETVRGRLADENVDATIQMGLGTSPEGSLRFIVGPWAGISADEESMKLTEKPARSGVFANFEESGGDDTLVGLNEVSEPVQDFGPEAGLVAATRRGQGPPTWIVTGGSDAGVEEAASALTSADLQHRYAAAVIDGQIFSLPLP